MKVHPLNVGPLQACCYLVAPEEWPEAAVIDPGGDADYILEQLRYRKLAPRHLLLTHGHIDHIEAVAALQRAFPQAQVAIHAADAAMLRDADAALASWIGLPFQPCEPDRLLGDGDTLALGPSLFHVLHTPGHTPGSVCFRLPRAGQPDLLFCGDTLFAGGIGRTDFPGGSYSQLLDSIRDRLFALPDDTLVYPGHGEPTTIGEERATNPFLR
ncbi:MAG TPA: MBL fold metallo-hydrolase [Planctomycetota bacterium]|nr:MBL fold metallo-hydrolase [Planctomycetota bacterium]HRR82217.1 MBL fold metallo-hydrolase [Planctomycetota bacterium]HRT96258.1 MBL fold metallo-hydrolase [Planctomycetota bacterium]